MRKDNSKVFILVLLGMLTAFGPFVTDMYLPSLPMMGEYFGATSSQVQLGLTTSMIGLAAGQVLFGPLSDRYGRRRPLIASMWLFLLSTAMCIMAGDIFQFVAFRLLQGIAGAGSIVISRSVATDKFSGRDLAKMLAVIGAINGVAPVIAPVVGGVFTGIVGWRGIFGILLGLGVMLLAGCLRLHETLPPAGRSSAGWGKTLRGFGTVLRDRQYVYYVMQFAFAQGVLFAYIASSPFIIQEHYGYSPLAFSICFAVNAISIGIGAAMSAMMAGCGFWTYEALMFCLLFGMGMTFTSTTALAMEAQRANAGTASALLGALGFAAGGIVSPLVGIGDIMHSTGIIFVICACCSMLCTLSALGRRRTHVYLSVLKVQKH